MAFLIKNGVIINDERELVGVSTAGITTALYVGENIQLDAQSGVITATKYAGSGADLTDIVATVIVSDGIPTGISTVEGDLYYDSTDLTLFTYYDNNWVDAAPVPPGATELDITNAAGISTVSIDLLTESLKLDGTANQVSVNLNPGGNGVTFGLESEVAIAGSMTAANFYGDGSGLTNLSISADQYIELLGVQAGVITATSSLQATLASGTGLDVTANANIGGSLTLGGIANLNGGANLGNAVTDLIAAQGRFITGLTPLTNDNVDLGTDALAWRDLYLSGKVSAGGSITANEFYGDGSNLDGIGLSTTSFYEVAGIQAGIVTVSSSLDINGNTVNTISTDLSGTNLDSELVTALAVENALGAFNTGSATTVTSFDDQTATDYPMPFLSAVGAGASIFTDSTTNEEFTYNPSTGILKVKEFDALSDARLKTDIVRVDDALGKVAQLRGVEYNWKNGSGASVGVIAQEVEEVYPQLVNDNGERLTVNYNGLVGLLIAAVNEMAVELAELKAQK